MLQVQGDAALSSNGEGLLGANVISAQEFQILNSSGDVFLHGDTPSFTWAYSCRELETLQVLPALFRTPSLPSQPSLQVAGSTALVFGSVSAVARLRQASLAARCILVRSMIVDGDVQV